VIQFFTGPKNIRCGHTEDATQLNQTVLLSRIVEVVTSKDVTQHKCFVESRRRRGHTERRDSTKLIYRVGSGGVVRVVTGVTPPGL